MPIHTTVGSDAASLTTLVQQVEESGDKIVSVLHAGDSWAVVTERKPRKPTR
jgi:hypothetical protein